MCQENKEERARCFELCSKKRTYASDISCFPYLWVWCFLCVVLEKDRCNLVVIQLGCDGENDRFLCKLLSFLVLWTCINAKALMEGR